MGIYINGMKIPTDGNETIIRIQPDGTVLDQYGHHLAITAVPTTPHGRLIDADALRQKMYHEAFEKDSPMQKWDSGCWIRYKMFERMEEAAPTIIPPSKEDMVL